MTKRELRQRFRLLAIDTAKFVIKLQFNVANKNYSNQLIRCSSSAAANYSASLRAKSPRDFINKFKIVEEELDETLFFLDLILAINPGMEIEIAVLEKEGNELLSIIVSALKTLRTKHQV